MDEMPVDQLIPQETPPANPQNRFPLKWALISLAILVVTIGVVLGIRKVNTINTNAASAKVVKNAAQLTLRGSSIPQPPLEFGSRASYERYVASQKIPARVKNNIFVDSRLRFGSTNGTDSTDQNPVDDELKPMTITSTKIICPDNSTLAGCDYVGGDGLQKAIDEAPTGSETDARRLLLKAGSYTRQTAMPFSTILTDGSIGKRQALFLTSGINPKYIEITSESGEENTLIDGFNSIGADGIVISAGRIDISKITLKGIHEFNYDLVDYKYECPKDKTCSSGRAILLFNSAKSRITHTRITDATFSNILAFDSSQLFIKNTVLGGHFRCLIFFDNSSGVVANNTCQSPYQGLMFSSQSRAIKIINNISSKTIDTQDRKNFPKKCDIEAGFNFSGDCAEVNQQNPNADFRANWTYGFKYGFGGFEKAPQWLTPDKLNRVADPMFVDPEHGDFHLKPNSPAKTAGVGGVEIGAYGNAQSPKSVKTVSVLTYLSADGTTAYVSECDGLKGTPNLADCTKPAQYSLAQIRQNGPANQSYVGISNYVYKQNADTNVLLQSLLDKNSTKAWYRRCSFNYGDRLNYDSCNDWSEVDTSAFQVPGAKKMAGIEGFIEKKGFDTVYTQSLIANDGVTSYGRSCKVNGEVVNFSSCSAWVEGSLENVAIPANITARFTEIDSWYSDSSSYYQALVSQRGDSLLVRYCPVVNSGVRWTSCESFENIPMTSIPGAPSQVSGLDSFSYQIAQ